MATASTNEMILVMGDVHIPNRINAIPDEIKSALKSSKSKFNKIICTGNYGDTETHAWLKSLLCKGCESNFYCVKTEDKPVSTYPPTQVITSNEFKIGFINGFQFNHPIKSCVNTKSEKRISTLLITTESVLALPTAMDPPSTV